jgi:superoxide reductase
MNIYHCKICGQTVEAHIEGAGTLVCCNQEMEQLEEKSGAEGLEKHKPVVEKTETGWEVNVGSIDHPMTEDHYIGFVQIVDGDTTTTKILNHTAKPHASFNGSFSENAYAREFCNLHGLWKND